MTIPKEAIEVANAIVSNSDMLAKMDYLRARWSDEREYEDINDYGKEFAKLLPSNVQYLRMSKRPFGPIIQLPGVRFKAHLFMKTSGNKGWLVLKWVK